METSAFGNSLLTHGRNSVPRLDVLSAGHRNHESTVATNIKSAEYCTLTFRRGILAFCTFC